MGRANLRNRRLFQHLNTFSSVLVFVVSMRRSWLMKLVKVMIQWPCTKSKPSDTVHCHCKACIFSVNFIHTPLSCMAGISPSFLMGIERHPTLDDKLSLLTLFRSSNSLLQGMPIVMFSSNQQATRACVMLMVQNFQFPAKNTSNTSSKTWIWE